MKRCAPLDRAIALTETVPNVIPACSNSAYTNSPARVTPLLEDEPDEGSSTPSIASSRRCNACFTARASSTCAADPTSCAGVVTSSYDTITVKAATNIQPNSARQLTERTGTSGAPVGSNPNSVTGPHTRTKHVRNIRTAYTWESMFVIYSPSLLSSLRRGGTHLVNSDSSLCENLMTPQSLFLGARYLRACELEACGLARHVLQVVSLVEYYNRVAPVQL